MKSESPPKEPRPLVSVIVPCYNHGAYLGEMIASLEGQTYRNFETIIVDDASPDADTRSALEALAEKGWTVLFLEENGGPARARNHAIAQARGTYIVPLDADDCLAPEYLEKTLAVMEAKEGADPPRLVYTGARFFGAREGVSSWPPYSFPDILWKPMIPATCLYRKEDWESIGGYSENMREAWEDYDFSVGLAGLGGPVIGLPEPLFYYRQMAQSSSRNQWVNSAERAGALFRKMVQNRHSVYARHWPEALSCLFDEHLRLETLETVCPEILRWQLRTAPEGEPLTSGSWPKNRWQRIFLPFSGTDYFRFRPFSHPGMIRIQALEAWAGDRLLRRWKGAQLEEVLGSEGSLEPRGRGQWQAFGEDPAFPFTFPSEGLEEMDRVGIWIRGEVEPRHLVEAGSLTAAVVHERDYLRQEKESRHLEIAYLQEVTQRRWGKRRGLLASWGWRFRWTRALWLKRLERRGIRRPALDDSEGAYPGSAAGEVQVSEKQPDERYWVSEEPCQQAIFLSREGIRVLLPESLEWQKFPLPKDCPGPSCVVVTKDGKNWEPAIIWTGKDSSPVNSTDE